MLNGASFTQAGRQYGLGRQRVLTIVRRACCQANPDVFGEMPGLSVPPYYTVPVAMLGKQGGEVPRDDGARWAPR